MRIGIAGGGLAGLTLAWLLDGTHEVVLLEERHRLGGNAVSFPTTEKGLPHTVDLGVRETPAELSPVWRHLVAEVGLPSEDLVPSSTSRVVFDPREPSALWVSPAACADTARQVTTGGQAYEAMVRLAEESARWEAERMSWDVTFGDVLDSWHLAPAAEHLLCALPASLYGTTLTAVRALSARAVGATAVRPDRPGRTTYLRSGTGSLVQGLASGAHSATIRLGARLRAVRRAADGLELVEAGGAVHRVDAVALALPADRARTVLAGLADTVDMADRRAGPADTADTADTADRRADLAAVEYRDVTYVLHRDPFGMPGERHAWSASNITLEGGWSETTTWYGPSLGLGLFVSQLGHRSGRPRRELARASFRAAPPTPRASRARQRLGAVRDGQRVFFLGHCTTPVETQEAAMASALAVAHHLAPRGERLRRLPHPDKADD
ncbi:MULTISPECIES: FAD-dependent oxidoreductase [unclassified Streptomyces]|uniref:FAD-dependent oxidoreductase n=1 Tax=unclassified Streptomyces TaxID=2593676 RepID=UPI0033BBA9F3